MSHWIAWNCLMVVLLLGCPVFGGQGGAAQSVTNAVFSTGAYPGEEVCTVTLEPEVRVLINKPLPNTTAATPLLVLYALPNGNTIEQTVGRLTKPGDDGHYNIQHIGAQVRFVRKAMPGRQITIAYLEAAEKSWPAWRKKHGNDLIPGLLEKVAHIAGCSGGETVLTGHSGGGSLTFGYINAVRRIPENIVRIAFLDSDYAYDTNAGHTEKLVTWLRSGNHFLCVLAYNDAVALLNGKTFVSAAGGTWGRSHAMWKDLSRDFEFSESEENHMLKVSALSGRVQFFLLDNPEKKILHTVQVERNGFIQGMLSGTARENQGYKYYGDPAWRDFVSPQ